MNQPATLREPAAETVVEDPANLAVHEAARQEALSSRQAHKSAASTAAGGALSNAGSAISHAAGWVTAQLRQPTHTTVIDSRTGAVYDTSAVPGTGTTVTQVPNTRAGAVPPMSAGAYGTAAATQTGAAMPQGTVGGSYAPSPAVAQTGAMTHGQEFKAHAAAALRGTGSALSHAKNAMSDKRAAKKYEKYQGEQAAMQPKYPAVVTPVSGSAAGTAVG